MQKPSIFIAVPTHRHLIDTGCAASIAGLMYYLATNKIDMKLEMQDNADIVYSRNKSAATMLADPNITHLLFIDTDMTFPVELVAKLVSAGKDLIGYAYPMRDGKGFVPAEVNKYKFENGMASVMVLGMGLCLIARSVFEKLIATEKVPLVEYGDTSLPGFFLPIIRNGRMHGEDVSFCMRWRELCGGKVYALASKDIAHIARVEVRASPV